MNRTHIAAFALALALIAPAGGNALAVGAAGWAVRSAGPESISGPESLSKLVVPAKYNQRNWSRHGVRRGQRHRRGFSHRRRHGLGGLFFSFVVPYYPYYPYYGYRPYYPRGDPSPPPPAYVPSRAYAPSAGSVSDRRSNCREVVMDVVIGGVEQEAYATVCEQADGSWKIVN